MHISYGKTCPLVPKLFYPVTLTFDLPLKNFSLDFNLWNGRDRAFVFDWNRKDFHLIGLSNYTYVFFVARPFNWYKNSCPMTQWPWLLTYCGWLNFAGYQFSGFLWRVPSTNSSANGIAIFCMNYEGIYSDHKFWTPRMFDLIFFSPRKLVPMKIKPSTVLLKNLQLNSNALQGPPYGVYEELQW